MTDKKRRSPTAGRPDNGSRRDIDQALFTGFDMIRVLSEFIGVEVAVIDESYNFIHFNQAVRDKIGYGPEALLGRPLMMLLEPDFRESVTNIFSGLRVGLISKPDRWRLKKKSGAWIETWVQVLKMDAGRGGSMFFLVFSPIGDVTASENRECADEIEARSAMEEALTASERRYRLFFNNSNDPVFIHWPTHDHFLGEPLEVNDAACSVLGYSRDELLISTTPIVLEEDLPKVSQCRRNLEKRKRLLFKVRMVSRQGHIIPMEFNSHLFDLDGQPVILSVARDFGYRGDSMAGDASHDSNGDHIEVWNIKEAMGRVNGDVSLFAEMVELFFNSNTDDIEKMKLALSTGDADSLVRLIHRYKKASEKLSASEMIHASERLEVSVRSGRLSEVENLLNILEYETLRFREYMIRINLLKGSGRV